MRFGIGVCLAVSMLMGAAAPDSDVKSSSDALQGVWQLKSGESDGKVLSETQLKGGKLVIRDDHYTVTLPELGTVTGTQLLGAADGLQTIDITDESGPHEGQTCLGLYELDGDEFRVIFAQPGEDRPSTFETVPGSGHWAHVWMRVRN